MKALIDQFGTSQEKEQSGAWIHYGEDLAFKVKRLCKRNKSYKVALERIDKELRRNKITEKEAEVRLVEIFVESALIEWKGVVDADGKALKLTKKNAIGLFTDPRWPEFFDDLYQKAHDNEYFNDIEGEAKN